MCSRGGCFLDAALEPVLWVLIVLSLAGTAVFILRDASVRGPDVSNHLHASLQFFFALSDQAPGGGRSFFHSALRAVKLLPVPLPHNSEAYPNFVYFSTSAMYALFGQSLVAAKATNLLYLTVLLLSVYGIGKRLGSRASGVLAAFLTAFFPLVFESSRQYGLDLPLTAAAAFAVLLLLRSDGFRDLKGALLLGLASGTGMLVKGQFAIFLAGPVIASLLLPPSKTDAEKRRPAARSGEGLYGRMLRHRRIGLFLLYLLLTGGIAAVWWVPQMSANLGFLCPPVSQGEPFSEGKGSLAPARAASSLASFGACLRRRQEHPFAAMQPAAPFLLKPLLQMRTIALRSAGLPAFLALLAGLFFLRAVRLSDRILLASWVVPPLLFFSWGLWLPSERHLMPVLPALAVLAALGLRHMGPGRLKAVLLVGLVLAMTSQYALLSAAGRSVQGSTSFGGPPRRGDPMGLRELGALLKGDSSGERVLIVALSRRARDIFLIRYRLQSADRRLEPLDFVLMSRDVDGAMGSMDYIVFALPSGLDPGRWPGRKAVESLLDSSADRYGYAVMRRNRSRARLLEQLDAQREGFVPAGVIRAPSGFSWGVFQRVSKEGEAGRDSVEDGGGSG